MCVCVEMLTELHAAGEQLHETFPFALCSLPVVSSFSSSVLDVQSFESH